MTAETRTPRRGDLKVWWIPQIPGKPFVTPVESVVEGKLLIETLGRYDAFQFEHRIKPDYSNAGGLMVFDEDDDEWSDWADADGRDLSEITLEELRGSVAP